MYCYTAATSTTFQKTISLDYESQSTLLQPTCIVNLISPGDNVCLCSLFYYYLYIIYNIHVLPIQVRQLQSLQLCVRQRNRSVHRARERNETSLACDNVYRRRFGPSRCGTRLMCLQEASSRIDSVSESRALITASVSVMRNQTIEYQ